MITFHDIIYPKYFTEDQLQTLHELEEKIDGFWNDRATAYYKRTVETKTHEKIIEIRPVPEYAKALEDKEKLYRTVKDYYINTRGKTLILEDVKLVVGSVEKKDYQLYIQENISRYLNYKENGILDEAYKSKVEEISVEGYEGCTQYILSFLDLPLTTFIGDKVATEKVISIVKDRVGLWYVEPEAQYFPMVTGKAIRDFRKLTNKPVEKKDSITKTITLFTGGEEGSLKSTILDSYRSGLTMSTDKLLRHILRVFTDINHTGAEGVRVLKTQDIVFSEDEYYRMRGYDIDLHIREGASPAEEKKERDRVKKLKSKARKELKKDLEILATTPISWVEKTSSSEDKQYKDRSYLNVNVIGDRGIDVKNGYVYTNLGRVFSQYAIRLPIGQTSKALMSLDGKKPNAYAVGTKLVDHYFNDNNLRTNKAQLLKVKTLLKETSLPTIEEVRTKKSSWVARIKEPFENILDSLGGDYTDEKGKTQRGCGLLEDWEYCHSKGVPLTEKERKALNNNTSYKDFEVWANTLIKFTLRDTPDQTDRLEAKAQRIESKKNSKKKPTGKKKDSSEGGEELS